MMSIFTAHAVEKFVKVEKWTEYTYQQGLSISLDISTCLVGDKGVKKLIDEVLDKFEKETGSRDLTILALVMAVSSEYGLDFQENFVPKLDGKHLKSVTKRCKEEAEINNYIKSGIPN